MSSSHPTVRRLQLTLRKPFISVVGAFKPTVVIGGRGYPGQWGTGTWQIPADEAIVVGVFLFNRFWRFGEAEYTLMPEEPAVLEYTAHAVRPGRIVAGRAKPR